MQQLPEGTLSATRFVVQNTKSPSVFDLGIFQNVLLTLCYTLRDVERARHHLAERQRTPVPMPLCVEVCTPSAQKTHPEREGLSVGRQ